MVCTTIFGYQSVVVVDANGVAVSATWTVTDTVLRTGNALTIQQQTYPAGTATVFSDNNLNDVQQSGDSVRVAGSGGGKAFGGTYRFGSDGCHIRKIAGPDTVVAR